MRGVGEGLFAGDDLGVGLDEGSGDMLGSGEMLGRVLGDGDGDLILAFRLGRLKFVLRFTALKLKFESNPVFAFKLTFGMFVLILFALAGVSFWSSQNIPAPQASTNTVPSIVNTTIFPVFCGGGGGG